MGENDSLKILSGGNSIGDDFLICTKDENRLIVMMHDVFAYWANEYISTDVTTPFGPGFAPTAELSPVGNWDFDTKTMTFTLPEGMTFYLTGAEESLNGVLIGKAKQS